MGNMLTLLSAAPQAASSSGSGSYTFLIVIVVLFALFYFVMIRPQRNRQRRVQEMQRQVTPGQRVRTTAGMYATVTAISDDDVTLEVTPGVHIRFMRRAIMDVLPDGDGAATPEASADGAAAAAGNGSASAAAGDEPAEAGASEAAAGETVGEAGATGSAKEDRRAD
jgi:preprotein translocase subunit YajC